MMLCSVFFSTVVLLGAEPEPAPNQLPRVPPVEPAQALSTFQVKKGFHLELVAAEPLVVDPIAMCFDENGRLFVVEMRDYSERRDEKLGRIRMLVDTDGDGRFDKSTIFAKDLPWPTALFWYGGGLFAGATPDIWYLKDTDGDGVADQKKLVFTGFGESAPGSLSASNRLNVQGLMNSFNWTLDNRIHGAGGTIGGFVRPAGASTNQAINLRGRDFSFDPRNLSDIRAETGGGQHGLTFDDTGRKFVCQNSSHIRQIMYEDRYASRNAYYVMPPGVIDIAEAGPAAEVYRISPEEPWRVLRTAWRVAGKVPGPIEGGGRASGYFTGATGITIYRGDAFPREYRGDAFIADVGSNLIHHKKLYPNGLAMTARRPPDEQKVEFIASKDLWFRPVQFANAPDGCLYVADMYREVIEHPWSIPQSIKKHLDLNSGNDRGRIYRIVPDGFKQPKLPQLGKATTEELVKLLEHPNGWHRDTAARLLYERNAVRLIRHTGEDEAVRANTIRLMEQSIKRLTNSAPLRGNLISMAGDPSPLVRYQLAFTLGEFDWPERIPALAKIIERDADDQWMRAAVLSSVRSDAGALFKQLTAKHPPVSGSFMRELALILGAQNKPEDVSAVVAYMNRVPMGWLKVADSLATGLERAGDTLLRALDSYPQHPFRTLQEQAERIALGSGVNLVVPSLGDRLDAIALLQHFGYNGAAVRLLRDPRVSLIIQTAALRALSRSSDPRVADALIKPWPIFTPALRTEALDALISRPERATKLLEAIRERSAIHASELSAAQIRALRSNPDARVRKLAVEVLGKPSNSNREQVINSFKAAVELKGDAARGHTIYLDRCATCHRSGKEGFQVGPDLVSVKNSGNEKLLISILDPNREVAPQYLAYSIETKDGETLLGIIGSESGASVNLLQPNGKSTALPRSTIKRIESQQQSLMPEGLEIGLSPQQMADLLEYIGSAR